MLINSKVFKALTRPAMFMGVPIVPLFIGFAFSFLIGIWSGNILLSAIFIPIFIVFRLITKFDNQAFQLLGLKIYLLPKILRAYSYKNFYGGNFYSASSYPLISQRTKENYTMLDLEKTNGLEEVIPYSSHVAEDIILTKDGNLLSTWQVEGVTYDTKDDADVDRFKYQLNTIIKGFQTDAMAIYINNVRLPLIVENSDEFPDEFSAKVNDLYFDGIGKNLFFENRLYVSLLTKLPIIKKKDNLKAELENFVENKNRFAEQIAKFGITPLTNYERDGATFSEQLELYHFLLTGEYQKIRVLDTPIYKYLSDVDIIFTKDIGEIKNNRGESQFFRSIEIKEWTNTTNATIQDILLSLNTRYVLTQSFAVLNKAKSKTTIDRQLKQLKSTSDDSISQQEDLLIAKDDLISGEIVFGEFHYTLVIFSSNVEDLKSEANIAISALSEQGFLTVLSNIALDEAYFSQLPANFKFRPRVSLLSSLNFADMSPFHNNVIGKELNNCWGNAVTVLKTANNTPFYFNFHLTNIGRNDFGEKFLGHTMILGKSGTGKTVLSSFLLAQSMKYQLPNSFADTDPSKKFTGVFLDKDYGAEINIKAMGGVYNKLKDRVPTGFNPFQIENTPSNIGFLSQLIELLITSDGSTVTALERQKINFSVNAVMEMPKELREYGISRVLENLQDDENNDNSIKKRLVVWTQGEAYGWVFDNQYDSIEFDKYALYGFDGTEVLDNKTVITPLAFYLIGRIRTAIDGRRFILMIDEFWKWLKGDAFKDFVYDGLKTWRKLNAILVCATQSPDEILKNEIAAAIIEQTETNIFLPNSDASKKDYMDGFHTSEKEFEIIKNLADDSRMFLVKKASKDDVRTNCVIAKLDLKNLGKNIKILSGSADNTQILEDIIEVTGDNPKLWIDEFLDKAI